MKVLNINAYMPTLIVPKAVGGGAGKNLTNRCKMVHSESIWG